MIRISDALQILRPGAEWNISGNLYSNLEWFDKSQTKPTEEEINQKVSELMKQRNTTISEENILKLDRDKKLNLSELSENHSAKFFTSGISRKSDFNIFINISNLCITNAITIKLY